MQSSPRWTQACKDLRPGRRTPRSFPGARGGLPLKGAVLGLLGFGLFSVAEATIKFPGGSCHPVQIVAFAGLLTLTLIAALWVKSPVQLRPLHPWLKFDDTLPLRHIKFACLKPCSKTVSIALFPYVRICVKDFRSAIEVNSLTGSSPLNNVPPTPCSRRLWSSSDTGMDPTTVHIPSVSTFFRSA